MIHKKVHYLSFFILGAGLFLNSCSKQDDQTSTSIANIEEEQQQQSTTTYEVQQGLTMEDESQLNFKSYYQEMVDTVGQDIIPDSISGKQSICSWGEDTVGIRFSIKDDDSNYDFFAVKFLKHDGTYKTRWLSKYYSKTLTAKLHAIDGNMIYFKTAIPKQNKNGKWYYDEIVRHFDPVDCDLTPDGYKTVDIAD